MTVVSNDNPFDFAKEPYLVQSAYAPWVVFSERIKVASIFGIVVPSTFTIVGTQSNHFVRAARLYFRRSRHSEGFQQFLDIKEHADATAASIELPTGSAEFIADGIINSRTDLIRPNSRFPEYLGKLLQQTRELGQKFSGTFEEGAGVVRVHPGKNQILHFSFDGIPLNEASQNHSLVVAERVPHHPAHQSLTVRRDGPNGQSRALLVVSL